MLLKLSLITHKDPFFKRATKFATIFKTQLIDNSNYKNESAWYYAGILLLIGNKVCVLIANHAGFFARQQSNTRYLFYNCHTQIIELRMDLLSLNM